MYKVLFESINFTEVLQILAYSIKTINLYKPNLKAP